MNKSHTLLLLALAIAVTLCVAACGSSTKTTSTPGAASSTQGSSGASGNSADGGSSGSSGSTGADNSGTSGSGAYPTAFVGAFIKGCDQNGGTKAYCECVISYIETNVGYKTVVGSQTAISDGKKPSWYTKAISGCLAKL